MIRTWQPTDPNSDEGKVRRALAILNKMAPEKFEKLSQEFMTVS